MNQRTKSELNCVVLRVFFLCGRGEGREKERGFFKLTHISEVLYYTELRLFYKHNECNQTQDSVYNIEILHHVLHEYASASLNSTLTHSTRAGAHKNLDDLLTTSDDTNPSS